MPSASALALSTAVDAPAVSARGLTRRVGEGPTARRLLGGVSLEADAGTLTAVIGPAGSGKSTLLHLLAGLDDPTEGTVEIDGRPLTGLTDREVVRLRRTKIGLLLPDGGLIGTLSARENVQLSLRLAGAPEEPEQLDAVLARFGLDELAELRPAELTEPQRRRVVLARALAARPSVLLADEPAADLPACHAHGAIALLRAAARSDGIAVVLATRDATAARLADHVVRLG